MVAAKKPFGIRASIATITVTNAADTTRRSAITIPIQILITRLGLRYARSVMLGHLLCFTALASCSDKGEPGNHSSASRAQTAHERGLANGQEMVNKANECEAQSGSIAPCKRACELNHSNSCANWGLRLMGSDPKEAGDLLQLACRGGSGIGCEGAARITDDLVAAAQLYLDARRYHRVHCSQGYGRSCSQLATLFREGLGGEIDRDVAALFEQHAQALKQGTSAPQ